MKLPNKEKAYIPKAKITEYLLAEQHPVGGSKAKFFRAFEFNESNADLLERALLNVASSADTSQVKEVERGIKYVLIGDIQTPNGRTITIVTVWIIEKSQNNPRFVTAYPK